MKKNINEVGAHKKVQRALKLILFCVVDFVVAEQGFTTLKRIEHHTGLKKIGNSWTADCLRILSQNKLIRIAGDTITGDVAALTKIKEQEKTKLPKNYGKPWTEEETVVLCELNVAGHDDVYVARKLERTENSVTQRLTQGRLAYKMIPWIKRHSVVEECFGKFVSPNAKR